MYRIYYDIIYGHWGTNGGYTHDVSSTRYLQADSINELEQLIFNKLLEYPPEEMFLLMKQLNSSLDEDRYYIRFDESILECEEIRSDVYKNHYYQNHIAELKENIRKKEASAEKRRKTLEAKKARQKIGDQARLIALEREVKALKKKLGVKK